jgi:hypothetical protein
MIVLVLILFLALGQSPGVWSTATKSQNEKPPISKTVRCDDPRGYSVEEGTEPDTNSVKIVRDGAVLQTITLPTGGFPNYYTFEGVKKTKQGFEIDIEYGSRIYYHKAFSFICRRQKFYLSKITVDSFDKQNPEKWSKKVVRVRPNVPLERFLLTNFMLEGIVRH